MPQKLGVKPVPRRTTSSSGWIPASLSAVMMARWSHISLSKARLFQSLQNALDYARDIDPSLMDMTVHTVYQPCNYQSAIL